MDPARQAALDRAAQQQGFRNYEEYRLWTIQREQKHQSSVGTGGAPAQPAPAQPAPANHLNSFGGVLDYVRRSLGGQ
jgi:hypothetical protein